MNTLSFVDLDNIQTDNLIHNRINLKSYLTDNFTLIGSIRNRIFYGEITGMNPNLGEMLDYDNGEMDLSFVSLDKESIVIHSIIDRAYIKYVSDKWDIRLGRQRINWGINLAWNPNDLFNAYSLIDFDYQERPGADAIRVQYFMKGLSSLDFSYQYGEDLDNSILAGLFKFNKCGYDFQVLTGNYYTDIAIGTGFAGNLKNTGIKGEITYFQPKDNFIDSSGLLSASITLDYSFRNGIYLNASGLYNSGGAYSIISGKDPFQSFIGSLSAKNLMPSELTYFLQASGAFNPALNGSIAVFYMQGLNVLFYMPSISYGIQENWDIMLLGQVAMGKGNSDFEAISHSVFMRLMWSF